MTWCTLVVYPGPVGYCLGLPRSVHADHPAADGCHDLQRWKRLGLSEVLAQGAGTEELSKKIQKTRAVSRAVSSGNGHGMQCMHSLTLDDKLCWLENMKNLERIPYLAWLKRV